MTTDQSTMAPPTPDAGSDSPRQSSLISGLVRSARPKQWAKNVLVFAAPGAAGVLTQRSVLLHALAAFGIFCIAASGTYFLNDALDIEADRLHPRKQHRPIAAGVVSVPLAITVGVVLLVASVVAAYFVTGWHLCLVIGIYVLLQPLYTAWLKQIAVIDLAAVASGFVLRAIAGGVAVDVPISQWFLIVASFGSLFVVAGKRHAEHIDLGDDRGSHRVTLEEYSLGFLRYVRSISSAVAIAAYCLWAFEKADAGRAPIWYQLSIVPFVLAMMRYALLLDAGKGGAPEDLILSDRAILVLGAIWLALFAVGVHAG